MGFSSQEDASGQREKQTSRLETLYGIAADIFRELGSGENFLRREREQLQFRKDATEKTG
jgi:hypothetical protein